MITLSTYRIMLHFYQTRVGERFRLTRFQIKVEISYNKFWGSYSVNSQHYYFIKVVKLCEVVENTYLLHDIYKNIFMVRKKKDHTLMMSGGIGVRNTEFSASDSSSTIVKRLGTG